jgi:hypothetical protein
MGAKPRKTGSAAKVPKRAAAGSKRAAASKRTAAGSKRAAAGSKGAATRRVPARRTAGKSARAAGQTVDAYLAGVTGELSDLAQRLREVILSAAPSATESIKWGQPVYEDGGPVCYFKVATGHITFGFWRGTEIDDPENRLEGEGDRMKHVKLRGPDDLVEDAIADWVRQAVDLNRQQGDPTRRGARAVTADEESAAEEVEPSQIESIQVVDEAEDESYDRPWNEDR